ncbi:hypothetical protein MAJHIDBO_02148 [Propionibacterium freudenreichii subsp. shermanii]|nr:hypothetical protein MAJHIDBO_02148 [Propionibacterium freudenreichii subsp. shermanii]SPS09929.1 hypothetical protein MAJHIDBO_02148 [Propionibacterium freudenreichii subsp. shermanii]
MAPHTVVPMPSSWWSQAMRSASRSLARFMAPASTSSISSGGLGASERFSSAMATELARSPAAAPPMPSATTSMVGDT